MTFCQVEEILVLRGKSRTLITFTFKNKYPNSVVP